MKEKELRKHAVCGLCKKKIGHTRIPAFWVVKIARFGIKMDAVQRQQGLSMVLGGHAGLASVMGPDEDMTTPLMDEIVLTVCETCSIEKSFFVAQIVEE